jgi:hypothetical protein
MIALLRSFFQFPLPPVPTHPIALTTLSLLAVELEYGFVPPPWMDAKDNPPAFNKIPLASPV